MKNFNFSLIISAYILVIGWVFTSTSDPAKFAVIALALSPLIWIAFESRSKGVSRHVESELRSNSPISHLLAGACAVLMLLFVLKSESKLGPLQFFGNFRVGWTMVKGAELLAINIAFAASALSIWAGYRFAQTPEGTPPTRFAKTVFAGLPELIRLPLFIYVLSFFWAAGVAVLAFLMKKTSLNEIIIITGRASIPFVLLIMPAVLRLRVMAVALFIAIAASAYLLSSNISTAQTAVYLATTCGAALVLFAARFLHMKDAAESPVVATATSAEAGQEESATSGTDQNSD